MKVTSGASVTVNVLIQVEGEAQELAAVNVTVVVPPQIAGADGVPPTKPEVKLQPPLAENVPIQAVNSLAT